VTASSIFIWFGVAVAALALVLFCLGWLIEQYRKHKVLAWFLIIGVILAVIAYGWGK